MTDSNASHGTPHRNAPSTEGAAKKEWAAPTLAKLADVRGTANTTTYGFADGSAPPFDATFS